MTEIDGYRELDKTELEMVDYIKRREREVGIAFKLIAEQVAVDQRWLAIAKTHFQEGFMALVRSVTRPDDWY